MKGISMELYRVFYEIGKAGSLTRAAEKLYVSQPNISAALKALEEQLQTILCVRSKKGISLTYEGQVLFSELEKAFSHIELAETKIEKLVHLESGIISISASDTICNYYLLPYITKFTKRYPGIILQITNRTSLETVELLKSGQVDFGFINLPYEDDMLSITTCCEIHDVLIGGSDYKHLSYTGITNTELSRYPLVMLERKSNSRLCIDDFFEKAGISLSPVLELGSLDLVISFVRNNMGLAFIPLELCGQFIDNDEIFQIELEIPLPARGIGLIELINTVHSNAAKKFKEIILTNQKNI
ncbi:MAG TPA: LysR family transcriptional regulator [Clostridiales bacterium]|nr:LysR family transcriptional regulator [Clostridiales bacterium]